MTDIKKTVSAGGVVRKVIKGKVYIVLSKSSEKYDWVLPKGHQEKGETIEQTAIREIEEETGLKGVRIIKKLGVKQRLSFEKDEYKTIHHFLFNCPDDAVLPEKCMDGNKIRILKWFLIDDLPNIFLKEQEDIIKENLNIIQTYGF